jgi:hypothetical protein
MMEVICSSKTLVLTRATQRHIPYNSILHCHRCETSNFTCYKACSLHYVNYKEASCQGI